MQRPIVAIRVERIVIYVVDMVVKYNVLYLMHVYTVYTSVFVYTYQLSRANIVMILLTFTIYKCDLHTILQLTTYE